MRDIVVGEELTVLWLGLEGDDDQIELFNPTAGQALADARTPGLIRQIR